jgi:hypothetical protein
VRVSCARSPRWATDAGHARPIRSIGQHGAEPGQDIHPGAGHAGCRVALAGVSGLLPPLSVRHGRLRRNAVSPHGVRLSGAPDAPPMIGCLSANRAFAVKLLRNGIVAVSEVFDAGCPALFPAEERGQPGGNARSGDVGEQYRRLDAPDSSPKACGKTAMHGGTQSVAGIFEIRRLSEQHETTLAPARAAVPGRRA